MANNLEASLTLKDRFTSALKKIDDGIKKTTKSMDDLKQKTTGPATALQSLSNKAGDAMSKLNSSLKKGMSTASKVVQSGKDKILSNFSNFGNGISNKFNLSGFTSKFSSGFNKLKSIASSSASHVQKAFSKLNPNKNINKQLDKLQNKETKIKLNVDNLQKAQNNINRIDDRLKKLGSKKTDLKANAKNIDNAKQKIESVENRMNKLNNKKARLELDASKLTSAQKHLSSVQAEIDKLNAKKFTFGNIASKIKSFGSQAVSVASQTGSAFVKFGGEMKNSFSQMGSAIDPIISKMGQLLKVGLLAGGAALVGLGKKVYDVAGGFEEQMSRVQAISGATGSSFDKLTQQAIDLGAKTAFSASESALGMENLASAGFEANEIMAAMPGMLDLAAISGGDVALAAENSATALRGFGLEADQAGHVADVFARAAADTNAEVADMGEAMKYVAPVANSMGLSIEEVAASIGIMSDAGVKGSQAGTTLRGALSRLAKPTKTMYEKMDELGLSFYDSAGQMKPLKDQIGMLQNAFKDLTPEQQQNALVTLYGQESLSGMMALIQKGPKALGDLTKSLEESNGAAQEMAETMQNNLKSKVEQLGGAFESAFIRIGQKVFPMAGKGIEKFTDLVDKAFSEKNVNSFFDKAAKYGTVLKDTFDDVKGPVGDAASAIKKSIEKITGAFGSKKNVNSFKGMMDDVVEVITKMANFAENHSDQIATLITNLPKIALAFAGFKIGSGILGTLSKFGGGLVTAATAAKNLVDNLKKIKKPKVPTAPSTPDVPGAGATPGVATLDFNPLLKNATKFAKHAGNIALVFGVIKTIEELAQAMQDINEKVPNNLADLAPKMANMSIALAGMGAFVKVAEMLTKGNAIGAATGLATIAGISGNLILAAVALQQINDRVSDDIGNVAKKIGSMAVAIGGMSVLVGAVGAIASTGIGGVAIAAGLVSVALIAGEMVLTAMALEQFNNRVPDDIGSVKEKIALMAEAIGAFTAANLGGILDLFSNMVGSWNIGVVTSGIKKMQTLAEELGKFDQIAIPNGVEDKITQLQDAIKAIDNAKFGELMGHIVTNWDYSTVTNVLDNLKKIANSMKAFSDVEVDGGLVKTKIKDINDAISELGTGMGFWAKIGSSFSNDMDASVYTNAATSIDAMIQLGHKLSELAAVDFDVEAADLNLIDITTIVRSMGSSGLGDLIGSMVQSAQLSQAQQSIQSVVNMIEPINQLASGELQAEAAITNINKIQEVLSSLAGLDGSGITVATTSFDQLSTAMNTTATNSQTLVNALNQAETSVTKLVTTTQTAGSQITSTWTQTMNQSKAAVVGGNAGMASAFSSGMAQSLSIVRSGNAQIVGAFSGLRGQLQSAGYFAMSGLAAGIQSGAGGALAAARSVANQVSATIRSALKVHSPSRVMMEIGQFVGRGLANGILAMQSVVAKASSALAIASVPDALASLNTSGTLSNEMVIDDSEISKLQASADQQIIVKNKQVVPQVTVNVDNQNGEPIDEDKVADLVSEKILDAMDSDLD